VLRNMVRVTALSGCALSQHVKSIGVGQVLDQALDTWTNIGPSIGHLDKYWTTGGMHRPFQAADSLCLTRCYMIGMLRVMHTKQHHIATSAVHMSRSLKCGPAMCMPDVQMQHLSCCTRCEATQEPSGPIRTSQKMGLRLQKPLDPCKASEMRACYLEGCRA
jgi:hypothetical protein